MQSTLMNKILIIIFICSISLGILSEAEQKFTFDKEAYSFDNIVQEELFYSLLVELRCPKCQSSNLSGSNSPISNDLKREVYELVIKEQSAEEIKAYLVERYGNFIIYNPPIEPATYILWFGPFLLIILSLGLIILYRRKQA